MGMKLPEVGLADANRPFPIAELCLDVGLCPMAEPCRDIGLEAIEALTNKLLKFDRLEFKMELGCPKMEVCYSKVAHRCIGLPRVALGPSLGG
jgi:hypothetical protein